MNFNTKMINRKSIMNDTENLSSWNFSGLSNHVFQKQVFNNQCNF